MFGCITFASRICLQKEPAITFFYIGIHNMFVGNKLCLLITIGKYINIIEIIIITLITQRFLVLYNKMYIILIKIL